MVFIGLLFVIIGLIVYEFMFLLILLISCIDFVLFLSMELC